MNYWYTYNVHRGGHTTIAASYIRLPSWSMKWYYLSRSVQPLHKCLQPNFCKCNNSILNIISKKCILTLMFYPASLSWHPHTSCPTYMNRNVTIDETSGVNIGLKLFACSWAMYVHVLIRIDWSFWKPMLCSIIIDHRRDKFLSSYLRVYMYFQVGLSVSEKRSVRVRITQLLLPVPGMSHHLANSLTITLLLQFYSRCHTRVYSCSAGCVHMLCQRRPSLHQSLSNCAVFHTLPTVAEQCGNIATAGSIQRRPAVGQWCWLGAATGVCVGAYYTGGGGGGGLLVHSVP